MALTRARFTWDGADESVPTYEGWHDPANTWNGWACPLFELAAGQALAADQAAPDNAQLLKDGDLDSITYDVARDAFLIGNPTYQTEDQVLEGTDVEGHHLYDFGNLGWTWATVEDPS